MRWLSAGLWLFFAVALGGSAYLTLWACELGISPLFGFRYCAPASDLTALNLQRDRERDLRNQIHAVELRVQSAPKCQAPCVQRAALPQSPDLAVVLDLSPSMNVPFDLTPDEATAVRAYETEHSNSDQEALFNRLMKQPHPGRPSRLETVKRELPGALASLGDKPVTVVDFRSCVDINSQASTVGRLPDVLGNLPPPDFQNGHTAIGASIARAAQSFRPGADGRYSGAILLVTDGNENCAPATYCQVAEDIARTKPGITISVVDLTGYTDVSCVATATGGRVFRRAADTNLGDLIKQSQPPPQTTCDAQDQQTPLRTP